MVASPLGVMNVPGTVKGNCCATPFLFQPTSVTMKPSSGTALRNSARFVPAAAGTGRKCRCRQRIAAKSALPLAIRSRTFPRFRGFTFLRRPRVFQRQLGIGHRAELGRIVPSDFGRIDIDMHQPGRRNLEREAGIPGAGVRFRQPCPDRQDQIRIPAQLVGNRHSPESGLAGQQRMVCVRQPLPIRVCDTGTSRASANSASSAGAPATSGDITPPPA